MSKFEQFTSLFLNELFKLALSKRDCCEIICQHLDYSYIPVELKGYKHILKSVQLHWTATKKLPTVGSLLQNNASDVEVHEVIDKIVKAKLPDKESTLKTLESYIKRVKFQMLFQKTAELYNNGQQEEAITLQAKESPLISNFSIFKDTSGVISVFDNFWDRDERRFVSAMDATEKSKKVPFGVDLLDSITYGGSEVGEIDCFLGRSGTGKTKWLRWRGVSAARRGFKVLHIQAEGTQEECELGYDCTWTGILKKYLKMGNYDSKIEPKLKKAIQDVKSLGGHIEIKSYEQFGEPTMQDVRNAVIDFFNRHEVYPDLLILDYLELFHPGNGKRYSSNHEGEKYKREDSARALKNICNEFKMRGATASQANDVAPTDFNNTSWVMTRHNVAGAKGLIDPFSYFFTWNVGKDEYNNNVGRLFVDKMREYKGGQTIRIATDFKHDRFFDRPRTFELWPEDFKK